MSKELIALILSCGLFGIMIGFTRRITRETKGMLTNQLNEDFKQYGNL